MTVEQDIYPFQSEQNINTRNNPLAVCYQDQDMLEQLFHKNNLMPRLCAEFESSSKIAKIIEDKGINHKFAINFLVHLSLRKQAIPSVLVGSLLAHADFDPQKCAQWIEDCVRADLASYYPHTKRIVLIFKVSKDIEEEIQLYQYLLPSVIPPQEINRNTDTGYLSFRSFIVANRNADNQDYNLDVINLMNSTPLHINTKVALGIENTWKNCYKKEGETEAQYKKKLKALVRYNKHAKSIIQHYANNGYTCYLVHKYDKRGRIYTRAYYLDTQGNPWNKGSLELPPEPMRLM